MDECGFGQTWSQKKNWNIWHMFLPIGISINKLLKNLTNKHKNKGKVKPIITAHLRTHTFSK